MNKVLAIEGKRAISFAASILVLCGLPGSGKSTLVKSITENYNKCNQNNNDDRKKDDDSLVFDDIIVIDYDEIASSIASTIRTKYENNTFQQTSDTNHMNDSQSDNNSHSKNYFTKEELEAWRITRKEALDRLEQELFRGLDFIQMEQETECTSVSITKHRKVLIIMDDNFHLRSMRRNVYQRCQQFIMTKLTNSDGMNLNLSSSSSPSLSSYNYTIGLVIIHVDIPFKQCILQNEKRIGSKQYVPVHIIEQMTNVFEKPRNDVCTTTFESNTISIYDINDIVPNSSSSMSSFYEQLNNQIIKSLSCDYEIKPKVIKSIEQIQRERELTMKSKLHRIDLLLRSLVSGICREFVSLAQVANKNRKSTLNDLRSDMKSKIMNTKQLTLDEDNEEEEDMAEGDMNHILVDESNFVAEFGQRIISDPACSITDIEQQEKVKIILQKAHDAFVQNQKSSANSTNTNCL